MVKTFKEFCNDIEEIRISFKKPKNKKKSRKQLKHEKRLKGFRERKLAKNQFYFLKGLPVVKNNHFENYLAYCKSLYFKRLKAEILKLANHKCKLCGKKANTAHHTKYRSYWVKTELQDCIAICNPCHKQVHNL